MNKFPYIGKGAESGSIVLFYEQSKGVTLESKTWASEDLEYSNCINEDLFKNITAEYLTNTYGKVESKEHAEFIVKLAVDHGFNYFGYDCKSKFFSISDDIVHFVCCKDKARNNGEKLITIPLPPKESKEDIKPSGIAAAAIRTLINMDYTYHGGEMWKPPLGTAPKKRGINEITHEQHIQQCANHAEKTRKQLWDDYMGKNKEWPQVGDEVLIDLANHNAIYGHNIDGKTAVVRSIFKSGGTTVYAVSNNGDCYCFVGGILKKPPTPEEKLADILTEITGYQNRQAVLSGAKAIINGEIEGLEYKPQ